MGEFPEKIWAIEKGYPSRYRVSCSVLEHGPDEATEYVRADLYAALEARLAEAKEQTELWKASSEAADEYIANMRTKLSALEATPAPEQRELSAEDVATFDRALLRSGRKAEATPPAPVVTECATGKDEADGG